MKKIIVFAIAGLFLLMSSSAFAVDDSSITKESLASMLISIAGIELPVGTENLPDAEYFDVLSNALAEAGINNFVGSDGKEFVTFKEFVETVFKLLGGEGEVSFAEKQEFITNNYPFSFSYGMNSPMTFSDVADFLNNPAFAAAVAEAYSPLEEIARAETDAPGFKFEETPGAVTGAGDGNPEPVTTPTGEEVD